VSRVSWRSSFLGDPGTTFLCGKLERGTKKEKSSKKERKEGLWKLTLPQAQQQASIYNLLQAAIHLKKAKFRSEEWGAPQNPTCPVKRTGMTMPPLRCGREFPRLGLLLGARSAVRGPVK
jgi:hypothetical protein